MPELPEVEVVRRGLATWLLGARLGPVEVLHVRPVRRHTAGPADFAAAVDSATVTDVVRRGKFLWLVLDDDRALMAHLGMSGQLLLRPAGAPAERHLRVRFGLCVPAGSPVAGRELRFVDQRMFGGLSVEELVPTVDGLPGGLGAAGTEPGGTAGADPGGVTGPGAVGTGGACVVPVPVRHIARDALDPYLDTPRLVDRLRSRRTGVKRALLDQTLVSGIGNIYADEALWRARLHGERPTQSLTRPAVARLLHAVREVMGEALAQGGTSFDSLYVNVNGESGYFDRALAVYGRENAGCYACGSPIRRESFMNRSSFSCPRCQPRPRQRPRQGGG